MKEQVPDLDSHHKVFHLFARRTNGTAEVQNLPLMLRQAGHDISDAFAREMVLTHSKPTVTFEEFMGFSEKARSKRITKDALLEAFRTFDSNGTGLLSTRTLRSILQGAGEPMTPEEVDHCILKMNPDPDGNIDYEAFIRSKSLRD